MTCIIGILRKSVRILHVNIGRYIFVKCLILGASLLFFFFFCQSLSPEPGKHSTTMQTMVMNDGCEGMVNEMAG